VIFEKSCCQPLADPLTVTCDASGSWRPTAMTARWQIRQNLCFVSSGTMRSGCGSSRYARRWGSPTTACTCGVERRRPTRSTPTFASGRLEGIHHGPGHWRGDAALHARLWGPLSSRAPQIPV